VKKPSVRSIKSSLLLFTLTASLLAGCSPPKVPGCTDQAAHNLLMKVAFDVYKGLNHDPERHQQSITSVRTRSTNDKTGAHECAADFIITNPKNNKSASVPFTYLIERLDNSPDLVKVEADGLKTGVYRVLFLLQVDDLPEAPPSKGWRIESK